MSFFNEPDAFEDLTDDEFVQGVNIFHNSRPEETQDLDESRNARLTTDVQQWADDPEQFDFPGVDTGPTFREENPDFELDSFVESFR